MEDIITTQTEQEQIEPATSDVLVEEVRLESVVHGFKFSELARFLIKASLARIIYRKTDSEFHVEFDDGNMVEMIQGGCMFQIGEDRMVFEDKKDYEESDYQLLVSTFISQKYIR